MHISPARKRFLLKILPYPSLFLIGGWIYSVVELGLLGNSPTYPQSANPYHPLHSFVSVTIISLTFGLILGLIEERFFKNRFRHLGFGTKIVTKTLIYLTIISACIGISTAALLMYNTNRTSVDAQLISDLTPFFTSFGFVSLVIFSAFLIIVNLFFSEITDYLGLDIVSNFFSGKYSKPVFENRIFMFLDMKDSTSIAERIGHEKQYELINEYFSDMSDAIVKTEGVIYQYVGDEIVISWKLEQGLLNANCLNCFFRIEKRIAQKSKEYLNKYGVVPGFRAGLHFGEVTRGKVGDIKRDLLYIGDVLNATSRIQGLCKKLDQDLLISAPLKQALPENNYQFKPMGNFELKGRNKKEKLFGVSLK